MTGTFPETISSAEISRFFSDRKIDAFCIADVSTIHAPAGRHPRDILPGCQTIIIFGVEIGARYFSGTPEEQSDEIRYLFDTLESAALALRDLLVQAGSATEAILPLPLKIEEGKIRGRLSLKYCAADAGFGTIGDNTLLIHPVYGNRLVLAAVITEKAIESLQPPASLPACTHCNRCIEACPAGAIRNGEVDPALCRAVTDPLPRRVRPLAVRLLRGTWSARLLTSVMNLLAPPLARRVDIRVTCTACVTACPYFHKGKQ